MGNIGIKFQSISDQSIYRVVDQTNHHFILRNDKVVKKVTAQELINKYIKIIPDAFLNVLLCTDIDDVYVCVNRASEIANGNNVPDLILRQNIPNQYNIDPSVMMLGDCITKYNNIRNSLLVTNMQCKNIIYSYTIALYINDKLDDIFELIPEKVLTKINNHLVKIKKEKLKQPNIEGCEEDLKTLMSKLNFTQRYREIFSIFPIGWTIDIGNYNSEGDIILTDMQKKLIADIIGENINITRIIKYDSDIDIEEINKSTLWLSDSTDTIYIVDCK